MSWILLFFVALGVSHALKQSSTRLFKTPCFLKSQQKLVTRFSAHNKHRDVKEDWLYFHDPGCDTELSRAEHGLPAALFTLLSRPYPRIDRAELCPHRFFRSVRDLQEHVAYCSSVSVESERESGRERARRAASPLKIFLADHAARVLYLLVVSERDPREHPFTVESLVRVFDRFALWRERERERGGGRSAAVRVNHVKADETARIPLLSLTITTPTTTNHGVSCEKEKETEMERKRERDVYKVEGNGADYVLHVVCFAPRVLQSVHGTAFQLNGRPPLSLPHALAEACEQLRRDPHNARLQRTCEVLERVKSTLIVLCDVLPAVVRSSE